MPKGVPNKRYTPEFKQMVVEAVREGHMAYNEAERRYEVPHGRIQQWERIYLVEGPEGLAVERRGRSSKGRPTKFPKEVEEDLLKEVQRLRAENAYLKKIASLGFGRRATSEQKAKVIQELRREHDLAMLLEIAQLPRSTFYYHSKRQDKEDKYVHAKAEISAIYHENKGRYGYRRVTDELHNRGVPLNHKTVQRLMKEMGLICRVRMKKYRSYKGEKGTTADNVLDREFRAEKPNQKWVTDVTEFRLFGQKLYLSPILDLYSGDIVTYTLSDSPNLLMVTTMLEQAFAKIPDNAGLLLHSDQGWHYRHKQYVQMLRDKGIQQSMSHKGNCYDNAVMENFFGHLKSELLYLQEFESMDHFKQELIEYIDYYNNRRIKARLKGLPPALHRQQALSAA